MPNLIIGKVFSIGQTQSIPTKSGSTLLKRELVIDASRYDEYTGEKRENYPSVTFMSRNCEKLDGFKEGDLVEVSFIVQGRSYVKDGVAKYINDVVGYKIEPRQRNGENAVSAAPAPAAPAAPSPAQSAAPMEEKDLPF